MGVKRGGGLYDSKEKGGHIEGGMKKDGRDTPFRTMSNLKWYNFFVSIYFLFHILFLIFISNISNVAG